MRSDQLNVNSSSERSLDKRHLLSGEKEFDYEAQSLLSPARTETKTNVEDEQMRARIEAQNAESRRDLIVLLFFWFVILGCGGAVLAELLYLDSRS